MCKSFIAFSEQCLTLTGVNMIPRDEDTDQRYCWYSDTAVNNTNIIFICPHQEYQ